jgi:hypothetical protein
MKFVATARILSTLIFAILIMSLLTAPGRFFCVPVFQFCSEALAVFGCCGPSANAMGYRPISSGSVATGFARVLPMAWAPSEWCSSI